MKHSILTSIASLALVAAAVTTLAPHAVAQTAVTSSTTTSLGTVSEFSPEAIVIRTESSPAPMRYTYTKSTTYVDEAGNPVSLETVKSGLPVTIHYMKQGDQMMASRVIVRRSTTTTTAPAGVEKTTTTTSAPAVIEKSTTTTAAPAPVIEEKKTTTTTTTTK